MDADVSVIKVGGSLLDWPELPVHLAAFVKGQRARVASGRPGPDSRGRPAANLVRRLDQDHHLGDETAHRLAIHAMDFTARFLAAILPGSVAVDQIAELIPVWVAGRIPVLIPSLIVQEIEGSGTAPLPRSWDTTSDSIAAWIAGLLGATSLVLLKSASLPRGADRQLAARLERVDANFPRIARILPRVEYLNLRDPSGDRIITGLSRLRSLTTPFSSVRIPVVAIWLEQAENPPRERCPSLGCCPSTNPMSHR